MAITLTPGQQAAVEVDEGSYLIVAPPGSGKTEVLVRRILRLLEESRGETYRILAMTFTSKAADNMASRIRREQSDEAWRVMAATFHSFCLEILRRYGASIGIPPSVSVYESDEDRVQVLRDALLQEGYAPDQNEEEIKLILASIDRLRRDLVTPEATPPSKKVGEIRLQDAYFAYERLLQRFGAVDFDGILRSTHQLLTEYPNIGHHYRTIYKYLLVDEGQDTNLAQYEILRALCGEDFRNVFMVADRNQSMYGFAGASTHYLERFEKEFQAARINLTDNFRCAAEIVGIANSLISHSPRLSQSSKLMISAADAQGAVWALSYEDEESEATAVVDWALGLITSGLDPSWKHQLEDGQVKAEDICILGRSRYALTAIEKEFEAREVKVAIKTGEREFFDSDAYRVLYFGLRILANPLDVPSRRNLASQVDGPDSTNYLDLEPYKFFMLIAKRSSGPSKNIVELLAEVASLSQSVDKTMQQIDELAFGDPDADLEAELWISDKKALFELWRHYRIRVEKSERSLHGFLGHLSFSRRVALDDPGIRLLTIHAAKGLEFRAVGVVGMNEGTFPDFRSVSTNEAVDDERRNAYVAVTRAERVLLITRPRYRLTRYGNLRNQEESRFIREMDLKMSSD